MLLERDCETVKQWLQKHPTIEVVTRDRSGEYREAITQALPDAVQIADRWHLLLNLGETIQRHISRRYKAVRQLLVTSAEVEEIEQTDSHITEKYRRGEKSASKDLRGNAPW